jgi:hypothetical protein
MIKTTRSPFAARAAVFSLALSLISISAQAATISYGNLTASGVTFQTITEQSVTDTLPLYGRPTTFSIGLDFNPPGFLSSATNGSADITDGQLNFGVLEPASLGGIQKLSLFEAGDYSLAGLGTPATSVSAGASFRVTLTQLNGANIAPVVLTPSNASIGFALPPSQISQPWSLGTSVNVGSQVAALFGPNAVATRVDVVIDNTLIAISEPGTAAIIAKKEFIIKLEPVVPEPGTFALLAMTLPFGIGFTRRRG